MENNNKKWKWNKEWVRVISASDVANKNSGVNRGCVCKIKNERVKDRPIKMQNEEIKFTSVGKLHWVVLITNVTQKKVINQWMRAQFANCQWVPLNLANAKWDKIDWNKLELFDN